MHQAYIGALVAKATADPRIKALWLEGSFGRGDSDRYSDLDLHLLLAADELEAFRAEAESWLSAIEPLVLFTLMFDGKMINALTEQGLRIDIWLHAADTVAIHPQTSKVLVDKGSHLHDADASQPLDREGDADRLARQIKEFWRCIALVPSVVGRDELIIASMGLTVETGILTDVILTGYDIRRDRGVKNLNRFLPADLRARIESALSMQGLSVVSVSQAHLNLAAIMREQGRAIAQARGFEYPQQLEEAVLRYVSEELALLGISATANEANGQG